MYRGQLWTMRQFAGFGSPEETNARFHFLLGRGQTALSVAFDLPTQLGYDSDHEMARAEVGRVGVAIDTADDMVDLFAGLPLDQVSVNFTINATAPIILATYLVAAERQGVRSEPTHRHAAERHPQGVPRPEGLRLPARSLRCGSPRDVVEFATGDLPRFNPISITGYHAREAGCDAVPELGLTMASAIAYCEELTARGLAFDDLRAPAVVSLRDHAGSVRGGRQAPGGAPPVVPDRHRAVRRERARPRPAPVLLGELGDHPHRAAAAQQRDPVHHPVPGRRAGRRPVDPRHGL